MARYLHVAPKGGSSAAGGQQPVIEHLVDLYDDESEMVARASTYLLTGLKAGEAVVTIATSAHTAAFTEAFRRAGLDEAQLRRAGRLVTLDAADTLDLFMEETLLDHERFQRAVGTVVRRALVAGHGHARAFGEMVSLLWQAGNKTASLELEGFWSELVNQLWFRLYCAYSTRSFSNSDQAHLVAEICHLHTGLVPLEEGAEPPAAARLPVRSFPAALGAPSEARHFVIDAVGDLGHPEIAEEAALVASELATNAVRHAASDFVVVVSPDDGGVCISVRDAAPTIPTTRQADPLDTSGRGLALVSQMAERWGAEPMSSGKIVWACLPGHD